MAGEDFAYYAQKVAACFIQLGCRNPTAAESYPLHHPCFSPDEECMKIGAALLAGLVREPRA
jgi:metal-dependent amidase/aminoacylase/carboxypeptidase family protein